MKRFLGILLGLAAGAVCVQADTIALYNFDDQTLADSANITDVTAGDMTATTSGWTINTLYSEANAYDGYSLGGNESTLGFTAVGQSMTLAFSVSSEEAYDLTTLSFQFRANSATTTFDRYSVTAFDGTTTHTLASNVVTPSYGVYNEISLDLSGIAALDTLSSVDFEIKLDGKSNKNAGSSFFGIDDVTVNAAIPEPAALTFVALTGISFLFIKRRFTK